MFFAELFWGKKNQFHSSNYSTFKYKAMDLETLADEASHFLVYSLKSATTYLWVKISAQRPHCLELWAVTNGLRPSLGGLRIVLFLC